MKIICIGCKKLIAEQAPYKDQSITKAKCIDCINKAKEQLSRINTSPRPSASKNITFENGLKGQISIAGEETGELAFGELGVMGRKFSCYKDYRDDFCNHLNIIDSPEVDVMFLHSAEIPINPSRSKGRKKRKLEEPLERKTINYNCTITVPKDYALFMFDNQSERMMQIVEVFAGILYREWQAEKEV